MTVVSAMKFNEQAGALVTDERGSYGSRHTDVATKIYRVGSTSPFALVGTAGSLSVAADVTQEANTYLRNPQSQKPIEEGEDIANLLSEMMNRSKRQIIHGHLISSFGLTETDFIRGQVIRSNTDPYRIDPSIMQRYERILEGKDPMISDMLTNHFLALTRDANSVELYNIWMGTSVPIKVVLPYAAVGTGGDAADATLQSFVVKLPRAKRVDIDPLNGIAELLFATHRASETNIGVGGTPYIGIIREGEMIMPTEENSRLALEVVRG